MPQEKESWTKNWNHQNWNGLTSKQIVTKKATYKKKAIANIQKEINKLYADDKKMYERYKNTYPTPKPKKIKYTLQWAQESIYYLNTFITSHVKVGPPPTSPTPPVITSKIGSSNPPPPKQP